jgi:transcriptional regulator with XRE-family HTH domain
MVPVEYENSYDWDPRSVSFRRRVGARIRKLRIEHGLSQRELARVLGEVDSGQVSRWERGEALPSVPHLEALARAFGCAEERVICGCEDP